MYKEIIEFLKDKKIAILGFGVEGKSTYKFIRRHLNSIPLTIIDACDIREKNQYLIGEDSNLSIVYVDNYL